MFVKYVFKIPRSIYNELSEKFDVEAEINRKLGFPTIKHETLRVCKIVILIPWEKHEKLVREYLNVDTWLEKKLEEIFNLPKIRRNYVELVKEKYFDKYLREKYQKINVWRKSYEEIKRFSKEKGMSIVEFIDYLLSLYKQLHKVTS